MSFVNIPMTKPITEITDEQVHRFSEMMKNGQRPMVLHCGSGNRISGLWAVWLVERQNMAPERAVHLARQTGMKSISEVVEKRLGIGVHEK